MTFPQPKKKRLALKASKGKGKKVIESSNKNSYVVVLLARKFRYFLKINKGFNNSKVDYTKGKF